MPLRFLAMLLIGALLVAITNSTLMFVEAQPVITLSGGFGSKSVSFTGDGFLPTDTTCFVSSPSSGGVLISSACAIQAGTGVPYGGFMIGNVLPGQYVIQVTGNQGDFAQAIVEVNLGPRSQGGMTHVSLQPGSWVSIHATGLLPTDTTCHLSSPSSPNVILPGTGACVIQAGTGIANGGFIIGNVLPGTYVIQVTGDQGDFAQTVVAVG